MLYTPTSDDIKFQSTLVSTLNDGAVWAYASALRAYRVDKKAKVLWLILGPADRQFERVKAVCQAIGWDARVDGDTPGNNYDTTVLTE